MNDSPFVFAASAVLAAATVFSVTSWLMRRREKTLAWLSLIGLCWFVANIDLLVAGPPHGLVIANLVTTAALFLGTFACFGFAAAFYKPASGKSWITAATAGGVIAFLAYVASLTSGWENLTVAIAASLASVCLMILAFPYCRSSRRPDDWLASAALGLGPIGFVLDNSVSVGIWPGLGIRVAPYSAMMSMGVLGFAILCRSISALAEKESQNALLEQRIEKSKLNLLASESARRSLEVSNAVTRERERMMREIHDGIGSSLVAALASAERQGKQSTTAVVALKSALTDLRIAVDSLEPVEGNVATLLASLRYRIEPELRKSGITIDWKVNEVPELDWLDSPNALHVLRIFQEALGNIVGHANATRIRVSCKMDICEGSPGIRIELADNGEGFDPSLPAMGRGRKNMLDRAEALGGKLMIQSAPGSGSLTALWLPFLRSSG